MCFCDCCFCSFGSLSQNVGTEMDGAPGMREGSNKNATTRNELHTEKEGESLPPSLKKRRRHHYTKRKEEEEEKRKINRAAATKGMEEEKGREKEAAFSQGAPPPPPPPRSLPPLPNAIPNLPSVLCLSHHIQFPTCPGKKASRNEKYPCIFYEIHSGVGSYVLIFFGMQFWIHARFPRLSGENEPSLPLVWRGDKARIEKEWG